MLVAMIVGLAWWQPWSLPDKPSIAVLPFTNMSGDPQHDYFADGMTDDLITDLSKISGLFVIARNSTFIYKNKPVKIAQIAEELGVRYVMEGSVQRAGNEIRINAQLIDSTSGGHVWAGRYDGTLDDVFSMRDQIIRKIIAELSVELGDQELESMGRVETDSLAAYDALLRGREYYRLFTPDALVKAIPFLENAIELDPDFARAHGVLAAVYWGLCNNGWEESAGMSYADCNSKPGQHLTEAMKNPTPLAHRIAARQLEYHMRWDEALSEAEKAIALDPNDPNGYQAMSALLVNLGRAAEGLEHIKKAMQLDPQTDYLFRLGNAQFHMGSYDEAAITLHRATRRNPENDWNYILLAAAYGHLGREQEARQAVTTFNNLRFETTGKIRPFTLDDLKYWSIRNEAGLKRLHEGMRKAGVPSG
jgi:TolB-like protein/Tfp pilus assembly protein PilF